MAFATRWVGGGLGLFLGVAACGGGGSSGTAPGTGGTGAGTGGGGSTDPAVQACNMTPAVSCPGDSGDTPQQCIDEVNQFRSTYPACAAQFDTVLNCLISAPAADQYCDDEGSVAAHSCDALNQQLISCIGSGSGSCSQAAAAMAAVGCAGDPTADQFTAGCSALRGEVGDCLDEFDAYVACFAATPVSQYVCDVDNMAATDACNAQVAAYESCVSMM